MLPSPPDPRGARVGAGMAVLLRRLRPKLRPRAGAAAGGTGWGRAVALGGSEQVGRELGLLSGLGCLVGGGRRVCIAPGSPCGVGAFPLLASVKCRPQAGGVGAAPWQPLGPLFWPGRGCSRPGFGEGVTLKG